MASATTTAVTRPLSGRSIPVGEIVLQVVLLLGLLLALAILGILVLDVAGRAFPVLQERGGDFLTSPLSTRPATAGVVQGIVGTMLIAIFVALIAFPLGV